MSSVDGVRSTRQRRWRGGVAAAAVLAAAGLVDQNGTLLLAAIIPLVYVGYGSLSSVTIPDELSATRSVEPIPAVPGRPIVVTLTVTNESDRPIPDLRIADGVPADLAVLEGSPRAGTTLEPGQSERVRYVVVARRGEYAFDPPQLRVRGLGAGAMATTSLSTDGDDSIVCRLDADAPPIERSGERRVGQLTTDDPGRGVTFHSVREHRPDDPADRIDWRQYAKRGDLATINYERRVSATVVLVIDARPPNHVVAGAGRPTAVEFATYAATRAMTDLLRRGHDVGVALLGLDGSGPDGLHWLPPAGGREQRVRALDRFRTATEGNGHQSEGASDATNGEPDTRADETSATTSEQVRRVIDLAPPGSQIALFSPVLDDAPVDAVETWRGSGLPVVVLAPDVVPGNTVSGQHAQVRRRTRLARCQSADARTYDWRRGTPLPLVIERAFATDVRLPNDRLRRAAGGGA